MESADEAFLLFSVLPEKPRQIPQHILIPLELGSTRFVSYQHLFETISFLSLICFTSPGLSIFISIMLVAPHLYPLDNHDTQLTHMTTTQQRPLTPKTGSFAEIPKDLKKEIEHLQNLFTVETPKLKAITAHFTKELEKGLTVEGGSIVSLSHTLDTSCMC